jgi:thymidylate kinase
MMGAGKRRIGFVSFSGIDGAGKSTQIETLREELQRSGLRVRVIRFWDDVACLTRLRDRSSHALFGGDRGVGRPEAPINRRDKNVQSRMMTMLRLCLYLADAVSLRMNVKRTLASGVDFLICDRYAYDEFANLSLHRRLIRTYVRLVMKLIPRPDVSFLLDADPIQARARKPEYPLDFLYTCREAYLRLAELLGGFTIIASMPVAQVNREVRLHAEIAELEAVDGCEFGVVTPTA